MMAASVGVKMPKTMPPMMMRGVTRVSSPSFAVRRTSPKGERGANPIATPLGDDDARDNLYDTDQDPGNESRPGRVPATQPDTKPRATMEWTAG